MTATHSPTTLVLQSHRLPLPHPWLTRCCASVEAWAARNGFGYEFVDDALFDLLETDLRGVAATQPVVASDLARLALLRERLNSPVERVVWCDADTLVLTDVDLGSAPWACGREIWLQPGKAKDSGLRSYIKVHNAFMQFSAANSMLDFYFDTACDLVRRHAGPMAPQFVGPKLLTALHNMLQFPVIEGAQVLSPVVLTALLTGDAKLLTQYREAQRSSATALNLCASEVVRGQVTDAEIEAVCELLLREPELL